MQEGLVNACVADSYAACRASHRLSTELHFCSSSYLIVDRPGSVPALSSRLSAGLPGSVPVGTG